LNCPTGFTKIFNIKFYENPSNVRTEIFHVGGEREGERERQTDEQTDRQT
jgi:methyl coenzyme M reductase alpha subunit